MLDQSGIVEEAVYRCLDDILPFYVSSRGWKLLYRRDTDGHSFNTLLRKCERKGEVIIFIRDVSGELFGAFYCSKLEIGPKFIGNGESFLFRVKESNRGVLYNKDLIVYPATMMNQYFCFCASYGLGLGADPRFGLFL